MKKMTKKAVSLGLVATMALSLAACNSATGGNNETTTAAPSNNNETTTAAPNNDTETTTAPAETTTAAPAEIVKPETIKVTWDGTIFKEGENYAEEFYAALDEALGLHVEWNRPDHSGYSQNIMLEFADPSNIPDVILLPASYYASLAANGALWDMTDAWHNSETYNSGRLLPVASQIEQSWYTAGPDGEKRIYGMYPARGNGTITYVKATWAEAAGYTRDTLPTTFEEFHDFLVALKEANGGKAPILAPGAISSEAPYTNYLPEFYQDAYPDFILDETTGQWVDGFQLDNMKEALQRLADAYSEGLLNADIITKTSTSDVRNMFYADDFGIFNYWAGTWAYNLKSNLAKNGQDDELWPLAPIAELGGYVERLSPMICITSSCENPEGVFKYFIDPILDGGDIQMLWMYGVEGVHYEWNEDGQTISGLATQATAGTDKVTLTTKNLFEANLKLGQFSGVDPYVSSDAVIEESFELFNATAAIAPVINMSDIYAEYSSEIWKYRKEVVAKVVLGDMTVDEAMQYYLDNCGDMVDEVLDSFN